MGVFDNVWHWMLRLLLRLLQFALCLVSLILVSTGFAVGAFNGQSTMLGGRYVMVTTLLTFLGMVYSFWWFVFIELLRLSPRPRFFYSFFLDLVLAFCLLISAITLLLSAFVRNCLSFGHFLRCTNLNAAVVFMFLAMASFLLSPLLAHHCRRQERARERSREQQRHHEPEPETPREGYQAAATPAASDSSKPPEQRV